MAADHKLELADWISWPNASALMRQRRRPAHPGEIFRLEWRTQAISQITGGVVTRRGLTQTAVARMLGWTIQRLNLFESGKTGVTPQNAWSLAKLTGTSPEFWMNLQTTRELWDAYQIRKTGRRPNHGKR